MSPSECPFHIGNPVSTSSFHNRRQTVRRISARLRRGESSALVGAPRMGKTSLLHYLEHNLDQDELYGTSHVSLRFSFIDSLALGGSFTPAQFWTQALAPIHTELVGRDPNSHFAQQYHLAQANHFGNFNLEVLLEFLYERDRRLVLLLDEFDQLIHHPVLNSAEFFGGMRALATRSRGLDLVIASRLPLARLHEATLPLNPTGSPFFNNFAEFVMGPFPDKDINELLNQGGERFTPQDRRSIRILAGGHPFLLQAGAEAVWDAFDEGIEGITERRRYAGQRLFREHRHLFADSWRNWTPEMRQAYTVVGLATLGGQLGDRQFKMKNLLDSLTGLSPELDDFAQSGLVVADATIDAKWKVPQQVMLWWLADELVRALRSEDAFAQWLRSEELEGRWTQGQRSQIKDVVNSLGRGAMELIERFASNINTNLGGA